MPSQNYQVGVRVIRRDEDDRVKDTVLRFGACDKHGRIRDAKVLLVTNLGGQHRPKPGAELVARISLQN